ncbi:MAG: AsmA-like C-terminal region-containing protein [Marinifilaceae bacterium]
MKKVIIGIGCTFGVIFILLMALPFIFKKDIINLVQQKIEQQFNVSMEMGPMHFTMFSNFPQMSVTLHDVIVTKQDTLAQISYAKGEINVMSLLSGKNMIINELTVQNSKINIIQSDTQVAIATNKPLNASTETQAPANDKGIILENISLQDITLNYINKADNSILTCKDIQLQLTGQLNEENTHINMELSIPSVSYSQNKSTVFENISVQWDANLLANFAHGKYVIQENSLVLNNMKMALTGSIAKVENGFDIDIKTEAPGSDFKTLFSIFPAEYAKQLQPYHTTGNFVFNAWAKGVLSDTIIPAFHGQLEVSNGSLRYPDLKQSVENINFKLLIDNKGGSINNTQINLEQLTFTTGNSPFHASICLSNPNDWFIDGKMNGTIDLDALKEAIPLDSAVINGKIKMDVVLNGHYRYIEQEEFEKFKATGSLSFENMLFKNSAFPEGIAIDKGTVLVTPQRLQLRQVQTNLYSSQITLNGYLSNYIPYFVKHQELKGKFTISSPSINLNEIIVQSMKAERQKALNATNATNSTATGAVQENTVLVIPNNIDLELTTNIKQLIFDRLEIKNIDGNIHLSDRVARLSNLTMNMLNGQLKLNGAYSSKNIDTPEVNLSTQVSNFDINALYNSFSIIKKNLPMAMNCSGLLSGQLDIQSPLSQTMEFIPEKMNIKGNLSSQNILINENGALKALGSVVNSEELKRISIQQLNIPFSMTNGNITVSPFTTSFAGNKLTMQGTQSVDGQMNYAIALDVKRKFFGPDVEKLLKQVPGSASIESLPIEVDIQGTLSKPEIKPNISKAVKQVSNAAINELKKSGGKDLLKGLQKLFK